MFATFRYENNYIQDLDRTCELITRNTDSYTLRHTQSHTCTHTVIFHHFKGKSQGRNLRTPTHGCTHTKLTPRQMQSSRTCTVTHTRTHVRTHAHIHTASTEGSGLTRHHWDMLSCDGWPPYWGPVVLYPQQQAFFSEPLTEQALGLKVKWCLVPLTPKGDTIFPV